MIDHRTLPIHLAMKNLLKLGGNFNNGTHTKKVVRMALEDIDIGVSLDLGVSIL